MIICNGSRMGKNLTGVGKCIVVPAGNINRRTTNVIFDLFLKIRLSGSA